MSSPTHIMLVEDHAGYREVLQLALEQEADLNLQSQFVTAEVALRSLEDLSTMTTPDLLLLDLSLPGMSGLDAIAWFFKRLPALKILILTQSDKEADILNAIAQGASGYLLKSATIEQILESIRLVMQGGVVIEPMMAKYLVQTLKGPHSPATSQPNLSKRELEILELIGDGLVKKEIAAQLEISENTVNYHVKNIYEKLNVQNAPAAIKEACRSGILPMD